jgi:copper transport protein
MTSRGRCVLGLVAVCATLALPAVASAHAYLVKTVPSASGTVNTPPSEVALTFDEAVEPRFAIISVTDQNAHQETTAPVHRSPANPDTLIVPLRPHLPEGWYLVYWRAISVDGHPVEGAFTFAIGPNPGPAPQFTIPKIAQTATTTRLLIARWAMFLSVMVALGLFVFRYLIARPVVRRVPGTSLRSVTVMFGIASVVGLVAIPAYLDIATSIDSLRSAFDVGNLVPLFRVTAFGRGYVDLEICFALFCLAAAVALWLDRPDREQRSIAELIAGLGALAAAAAVLAIPGASGHAGQTSPRGLALAADWLHLISGSVWLGGLLGLIVLWRALPEGLRVAGLQVSVPRFSNVAFCSVGVLLTTGIVATILHMPLLAALWETSYGQAILVKSGLLLAAMGLGAVNLLRTKPQLDSAVARPEAGPPAARLLRRAISGEAAILICAVFAAAVLSSLAPPASALAEESKALARVGPGHVAETVKTDGYTLQVLVSPNKAAAPNSFALKLTRHGKPVQNADVTLTFAMLDMQMANQEYQLEETSPGIYSRSSSAFVMVGHWGLTYNVTPKTGLPFSATIVDRANG